MRGAAPNLDLNLEHLRTMGHPNEAVLSGSWTLNDVHALIANNRDVGNGHYISVRHYPSDDVEATAVYLQCDDHIRKGGGAKRKNTAKAEMDKATLEKSKRRAKTQVRRKCMSMCADRLLTLTFRENVTDLDEAWTVFKHFCRLMRWRYAEKFTYVAVPEFQKRGAVHFHLAVSGYFHANTVRRLWQRATGYRGGNVDITSPKRAKKNSWSPRRVANYISKYITEDEIVAFNRRRFASGGKIEVPEPVRGFCAYGVPIMQVLRDVIERISRFSANYWWSAEGRFPVFYMST